MRTVALAALFIAAASRAGLAQTPAAPVDKIAAAYEQFLVALHLEAHDDVTGAIAAYKKAMAFDPAAADIPAELAALYMRQSRAQEALDAAEQALELDATNREAHRVAGIVHAALGDALRGGSRSRASDTPDPNVVKAIAHLEKANDGPAAEIDPNTRATLARLYVRSGAYAKAIPLLSDLVNQEPGWQEGPMMLADAYAGAGKNADAIAWLSKAAPSQPQLYPTLAEFYERERRWKEAASAYARAVEMAPRNTDLKIRYATALVNSSDRADLTKARDLLNEVQSSARPNDTQPLYLLSQVERRLGNLDAAEAAARRAVAQNAKSPFGYFALAEALEERRQYQAVIDALTPAVAEFRGRGAANDSLELKLLLPHLGFAYQELGQFDKALPVFEEAHKLAPDDAAVASYLVQANIAAKKYTQAAEIAHQARAARPDDLRLARLEAQALRHAGKADQGIRVLEGFVKERADEPGAHIALAELYAETDRSAQAVSLLQEAQRRFPDNSAIVFQLGAVFDKQKRFAEAEAAFKQVIAREPEHAQALNYLGYMLAEHGERLEESVGYIKKALALEPENGSYLDSLGWAYFKQDKLDLAEENLKKAATQLTANSVIQDHYGDVLFKRGRYDEAIAAWTRALSGAGDAIDRGAIDRKIRSAKQKTGRK